MDIETMKIYSEVYQILGFLGNNYIEKLPKKLIVMLKEKRDISYNPEYTENLPLSMQNIRKETVSILALLYINYWCENEEEKDKLRQIFNNNEKKLQENAKIKYNLDNFLNNDINKYQNPEMLDEGKSNKEKNIAEINDYTENKLVEYKESIFKKIIKKIKSLKKYFTN